MATRSLEFPGSIVDRLRDVSKRLETYLKLKAPEKAGNIETLAQLQTQFRTVKETICAVEDNIKRGDIFSECAPILKALGCQLLRLDHHVGIMSSHFPGNSRRDIFVHKKEMAHDLAAINKHLSATRDEYHATRMGYGHVSNRRGSARIR